MEQVSKTQNMQIVKFDREDYLKNADELTDMFTQVFQDKKVSEDDYEDDYHKNTKSGEGETALKSLKDFFEYNEKACLYFLLINNKPVSTALFSTIDDHKHLEIVGTNFRYRSFGYARQLLNDCFYDLANSENMQYVTSCVNEKNHKSQYLHESLLKIEGVKGFLDEEDDRTQYTFDISNIQKMDELTL